MNHLPYDICIRLRDAGLPQPQHHEAQFWYHSDCVVVVTNSPPGLSLSVLEYTAAKTTDSVYIPDAEYLLAHLPDTIKIEKYNNQYMVMAKGQYKLNDNLTHAAAALYLVLFEKTSPSIAKTTNK